MSDSAFLKSQINNDLSQIYSPPALNNLIPKFLFSLCIMVKSWSTLSLSCHYMILSLACMLIR